MAKYRKKPVVIEAVPYALNEYADNPLTFKETPPQWLQDAVDAGKIVPEFRTEDYWYLVIHTEEGPMDATPDDYIIRDVQGELYPCKPDIFEQTYERIDE